MQGKDWSSFGGTGSTEDASTLAAVVLWIKENILHVYATLSSGVTRNTPRVTCIFPVKTQAYEANVYNNIIQVKSSIFPGVQRESVA